MAESADKHRARAHVGLEDLLAECDEVRTLAKGLTRSYKDRNGRETTFEDPDVKAMLQATELKAKLLGLLGDGRTMDKATLERELDRMGYRLEPKMKRVG